MRITGVNPEAIDLKEAKMLDDFSEVKIHVVGVNTVKICTKANIRVTITKVIITKAIVVYIITHIEIINKVIIMANLEAEAMVLAEVITADIVMVGLIIVTSTVFESKDEPTQMTKQSFTIIYFITYKETIHFKLICINVHS